MSSEIPTNDEPIELTAEAPLVEVNAEEKLSVNKILSINSSTNEQFQQILAKIFAFISQVSGYVAGFFKENQSLVISLGWILVAFVTLKVVLALLDAINGIPLLGLMFELVGLAYITWFIYRYLLSATKRQELSDEVKSLKEQVLGSED